MYFDCKMYKKGMTPNTPIRIKITTCDLATVCK